MNDDLNLKLSQLVDGELAKDESVKLFDLIHGRPELEAKLRRYEMVSGVIKSDDYIHAEDDFVTKVNQSLQKEVVVFAPAWRQKSLGIQSLSAIAASIAIIGIVVFGGMNLTPETLPPTATTIAQNVSQDSAVKVAVKDETVTTKVAAKADKAATNVAVKGDKPAIKVAVKADKAKVDPRFIEYLEAHDDSLYAAGSPGYQSYVRVVSYGNQ